MTKRIFAVALSCVMAFSLAACERKKDDTSKAKDVVKKFMTALKNVDTEGIKKIVDKKHADELKNDSLGEQKELMKKFLSKSAATFKSGEIKKDSTMGVYEAKYFFQAEDGIRDSMVTGVQTCALPIYDTSKAKDVVKKFMTALKNVETTDRKSVV